MNNYERKMLAVLQKGREKYGFVALKAEFEAEGTRLDELYRLIDLGRRAGLKLGLKIGGCEAVSDLYQCRQFGADYIIAPMVETEYAVFKYVQAKNKVYTPDERTDTKFLFNLETKTGYEKREALIEAALAPEGADGVVFGRVDFSESMGWGRESIGDDRVTERVIEVAKRCKEERLELVVGGGVAIETIPALKQIQSTYLTRFETRKVIFAAEALESRDIKAGVASAVQFELLWLQNKREYYGRMSQEDSKRLGMMEARWETLSKEYELS